MNVSRTSIMRVLYQKSKLVRERERVSDVKKLVSDNLCSKPRKREGKKKGGMRRKVVHFLNRKRERERERKKERKKEGGEGN